MQTSRDDIVRRFDADRFATDVTGIDIIDATDDWAVVKLDIEPRHHNAVGIVQGGVIFTLADFAFAIASNAARKEETVVAIECSISFIKPISSGELFAEAQLVSQSKSLCSYEVEVTDEKDELIAKFYGRGFIRKPR